MRVRSRERKKKKKIDITKTTNMCHFHSHEDDKSESVDKIWWCENIQWNEQSADAISEQLLHS